MHAKGFTMRVARRNPSVGEAPFLNLNSGYIQRAQHILPRQGVETPWRFHQNYVRDILMLRYGKSMAERLSFPHPTA
jgi:cyclohexanone monooxygenase